MTVTLELLFPHLDDLIQTPADVQRLNEAILQLAVQGKLVAQDPGDEPAEELLKRIEKEKEQLVQEGRTTSSKLLPLIDKSKMPFVVPQGWIWCWLAHVSDIEMGQSPPGNSYNSTGDGVPLINGPVEFSAGPFGMTLKDKFTTAPTKMCREGDLLVCVRGSTTGRTNIAAFDACIGRGVAAIRSYCFQRYLNYFILKYRQEIYDRGTGTTFPSISQNELLTLPFPLPPLAEQKRIVAKVDELFAQTRALEAKLRRAQEAIVVVNRAVLHHLHHAADNATFQHATQILGDHFDLLYTDPRPVTDLRQTILQLAVQGKLVPQDPQDEPAGELLKRIAAERRRLVEDKKLQDNQPLPKIRDNEKPFALPLGWAWVRFGEAVFNRDSERIPLSRAEREHRQGEYDYYGASGVIDSIDKYLFDKPLLLIGEDGANSFQRQLEILIDDN